MVGAKLMLALLLGQVHEPSLDASPATLVAQLGAARYADRQAAAEALERIGAPALSALRTARESRDMEIRTRASVLTQKIEAALLTQATRIQLDFENVPLTEVTKSLSLQTGFKVALSPQNLPKWKFQRVTLRRSQPVDFWTAVDQLCDAAGLEYNSSMQGSSGQRDAAFALSEGTVRAVTPISDHGPFRVSLLGVDYERHLTYIPNISSGRFPPPRPRPFAREPQNGPPVAPTRLNPVTNIQFNAHLLLTAEPRLFLTQRGMPQLTEAFDERGNSLRPANAPGRPPSFFEPGFTMTHGPVLDLQLSLHRPAEPGEFIKRLRGTISLVVASRRRDPLVVPLANAAGKTFENPDLQVTVHEIRALPTTQNTLLDLTVTANEQAGSLSRGEAQAYDSALERIDRHRLQIEVLDTRGQSIPWFQSAISHETSRFTLTLTHLPQTTEPKELRDYALTARRRQGPV